MIKLLTTLLFTIILFNASAQTRKVLFLGNSYTQYNDLPNLVKQIAASFGDTLITASVTPGGFTLEQHSTNAASLNAIKQDQWDIVVLQEQSQKPSFSPSQVATEVYPFAEKLVDSIKANNSCSQPMFYMTWGRKNGDAANCPFYPPVCTYGGMQQRLRESYMQMAQDNNGITSPVGAAWKMVRDSLSSIDLYNPDESHPSLHGSYLAACVFYASIFHKNPHGSSYTAGLSNNDAERLQYFAAKTAIDSVNQWQQHASYPYTSFGYTIGTNLLDVSFQNNSLKANSYSWDFGDGNSSIQISPNHTYAQQGKYGVKLTASDNCFSETRIDTVNNSGVGVSSVNDNENIKVINSGNGNVTFYINQELYNILLIYNTNGALIKRYSVDHNITRLHIQTPGIYIYKFTGTTTATGRFTIY